MPQDSRPQNILILCPDEMKATAMSCYGNPVNTTPFLDQLARDGARFDQCHTVHPKCVPSRAAFTSAQYPHVNGHRTLDLEMRPYEINLIRHLKENGYNTALVGKNHTVDRDTLPGTFDYHERAGRLEHYQFDVESGAETGIPFESYYVGEARIALEEFGDFRETECAKTWLKEGWDRNKPFFLWLNWNAPHPPYSVPSPYFRSIDRGSIPLPPKVQASDKPPHVEIIRKHHKTGEAYFDDASWQELIATYYEMCRFVDDETRRIYEYLREIGELENTIIVFWSDHGDFAGEYQLPEKWDTAFNDCITRVPFLVHYPRKIRPVEVEGLVETIDILPTVLRLAGIEFPKGIQGRDASALLRDGTLPFRELVFCQGGQENDLLARPLPRDARPRPAQSYLYKQDCLLDNPEINARAKMIRDQRYKYTYRLTGFEEFYDLQQDPWETINQAGNPAFSDKIQIYRQKLINKLIEAETVEPYQEWLEA